MTFSACWIRAGLYWLSTERPTLVFLNEAILVVVDANRTQRAFPEIENLVTCGRTFAGDGGHLVVAVQMYL